MVNGLWIRLMFVIWIYFCHPSLAVSMTCPFLFIFFFLNENNCIMWLKRIHMPFDLFNKMCKNTFLFFCLFWIFSPHFRVFKFKWKTCLFYQYFTRKLYDRLKDDIHFYFNQLKSFQRKFTVKYEKRKKYVDVSSSMWIRSI